jgi:hypothetical protein
MGLPDGTSPDYYTCARVNLVEEKMAASGIGSPHLLKGVSIHAKPARAWYDPWGRLVGGYTTCATKQVHIGTGQTVLAHELAHVLQECSPEFPIDEGSDADHADWLRKGIYLIIDEASL